MREYSKGERERLLSPPEWVISVFVFSYLLGLAVLKSYLACTKENETVEEFVHMHDLSAGAFFLP